MYRLIKTQTSYKKSKIYIYTYISNSFREYERKIVAYCKHCGIVVI